MAPRITTEFIERIQQTTFAQFCALCSVTLTPGQSALAAVLFDNWHPHQLPTLLRALAAQLFGADTVPALARATAVIVAGGRSGKSYLLALRALHLSLTVPLNTLAPGEEAFAIVVAPDKRLAKQALNYVRGALASAGLSALISADSTETVSINRGGRTVTIAVLPASAGGASVRGRSLVCAILDEAAFFRDASYAVNDVEIFRAASPRVITGGQTLVGSTPWARGGLLFDLYKDNFAAPKTCVVAHAPTTLLRNGSSPADLRVLDEVKREFLRDPENARREFGAEFLDIGTDQYFSTSAIDASVNNDIEPTAEGDVVSIGIDLGFSRDSSALVAVATNTQGNARVVRVEEVGSPAKPSEVAALFASIARSYGATAVITDLHYREAVREWLQPYGLGVISAPEGNRGKIESYDRVKRLFSERKLSLPTHARLLSQLRGVVARTGAGGTITISSPRTPQGGHGDIVSALVCACSKLQRVQIEAPIAPYGTDEYWAQEQKRMRSMLLAAPTMPLDHWGDV